MNVYDILNVTSINVSAVYFHSSNAFHSLYKNLLLINTENLVHIIVGSYNCSLPFNLQSHIPNS